MAAATTYSVDYLIVGNSAAGVSAAEAIRATEAAAGISGDQRSSVLILSREPYAVYGRPLISYLIEGKTSREKIGFRNADFYEVNDFQTLFGADYEAVDLDPAAHVVTLKNGETVAYGKVLLATGSNPANPAFPGLNGQENIHGFLTLDDALEARDDVVAATAAAHAAGRTSRVVVVGGGLTGLKAAEALSAHADEVLMLSRSPHVMRTAIDDAGGKMLHEQLAAHGVVIRGGVSCEEFFSDETGTRVASCRATDGSTIDLDALVLCVGVRPNSALAVDKGAEQGRGLVVGEDMQTSLPDVYAAGDLIQSTDLLDGSKHTLALWPNALQQGRLAGQHMAGSPAAAPYQGGFAVNAVDFFDISLLTCGLVNPTPESGCVEYVKAEGNSYTKFVVRDDKLVGYILLNKPAQAGVYTALIESGESLAGLAGAAGAADTTDAANDQLAELFANPLENIQFAPEARWERLHRGYPSTLDRRGWKERA